jgi:Protein of unknown function (DUF2934)
MRPGGETSEVIIMAKSAKRRTAKSNTDDAVTTPADRSSKSLPNRSAQATISDTARRAYDLYLARGREHGHDLEDWVQPERELQATARSPIA